MAREHRSVRVDQELLDQLAGLARERLVPVLFSEQVDAGLRMLTKQAADAQVRRSAALVAADDARSQATYRRLHGERP